MTEPPNEPQAAPFLGSAQINQLAASMAKAQAGMEHARKDAVNPHLRSKYATLAAVLDAVMPALNANGISLVQTVRTAGSTVSVLSVLLHASGQWLGQEAAADAKDRSPQALGAVVTYLRRYSALAICGIAAEDDDGQAAQPKAERKPPGRPPGKAVDPLVAENRKLYTALRAFDEEAARELLADYQAKNIDDHTFSARLKASLAPYEESE